MLQTHRLVRGVVWVVVVTGLALPRPAQAQDEGVDLRPHFRAGRSARYELWYDRAVVTTLSFQDKTQSVAQHFHYDGQLTWRVDSVAADGSAHCTLRIDWLALTTSAAGATQTHDTRKRRGDNPAVHQYLKAMTDKPLGFVVSSSGTIQKVEGVQAVRADTPEALADAVLDEQFIEMAYDLALLPGAPRLARPGDRWNFTFRGLHELGWIEEKSTLGLVGVEDIAGVAVATIKTEDRLSFEPRWPALPGGAPTVKIRMTSSAAGKQILWDLSRHEAVGRHSDQSRSFEVRVTFQGKTLTRTVEERSRQQVLRIAED